MRVSKRPNHLLGDLMEVEGLDVTQIPVAEYSEIGYELPNRLDRQFGNVVDPLQVLSDEDSAPNRITSLIKSQSVEAPIYVTQIGVVAVPDIRMYTLNGVDVALPSAAGDTPKFDGSVPLTGVTQAGNADASSRPAQFQFGHDAIEAAWAFLQSYRLVFSLGSRIELFNELAANIGACIAGNVQGFGSSNYSPVADIARANRLAKAAGNNRAFLPRTFTGAASGAGTPAEPPLVPVAYGSLQTAGIFGGWYPTRGLLLTPGMPINLRLERTPGDSIYHDRLARAVADRSTTFETYSEMFNGIATGAGFAGAKVWKGGSFRVGIIMRGYELAPLSCVQAYQGQARFFDASQRSTLYAGGRDRIVELVRSLGSKLKGCLCDSQGNELGDEVLSTLAGVEMIDVNRLQEKVRLLGGP